MYNLAQANIAKMLAPLYDPIMADFVNNLDRINALAEKSEGFVWCLEDMENNATAIRAFEDDTLNINMSVWKNMESLFQFTYKSDHVEIFSRRKEWFNRIKDMHMVFWLVPVGDISLLQKRLENILIMSIRMVKHLMLLHLKRNIQLMSL